MVLWDNLSENIFEFHSLDWFMGSLSSNFFNFLPPRIVRLPPLRHPISPSRGWNFEMFSERSSHMTISFKPLPQMAMLLKYILAIVGVQVISAPAHLLFLRRLYRSIWRVMFCYWQILIWRVYAALYMEPTKNESNRQIRRFLPTLHDHLHRNKYIRCDYFAATHSQHQYYDI